MALSMLQQFSGTFSFNALDGGVTLTQKGEIILGADTTSIPAIINIPSIATFFLNQTTFRIKIVDFGNNASVNSITINTASGDTIDGGVNQFVINTNGGIVEFIMVGTNKWAIIVTQAVAVGAMGQTIYKSSSIITSAQILAMNTLPITLVSAQGAGIVIKPIGIVTTIDFNSIAYLTGGAITTFQYGSFETGVSVWDTAFITNSKDDIYDASYTSLIASGTGSGFNTYANQPLRIKASGAITAGNSPLRNNVYWIAIKGPN